MEQGYWSSVNLGVSAGVGGKRGHFGDCKTGFGGSEEEIWRFRGNLGFRGPRKEEISGFGASEDEGVQ